MKTILITAYAINPYKGSEDGTGWNLTKEVAKFNKVIIITRLNNVPHLDKFWKENNYEYLHNITYYGFDLSSFAMKLKKRAGERGYVAYYYFWQYRIVKFIKNKKIEFDIAHSLNFHSDSIPTFLWKLKKPTVWGPIGHHPRVPKEFITTSFSYNNFLKDKLYGTVKKLLRKIDPLYQISKRKIDQFLVINSEVNKVVKADKDRVVCLPAVGDVSFNINESEKSKQKYFKILSVGRFHYMKGFDLTIKSYAKFISQLSPNERTKVKLCLVGKGEELKNLQKIAADLDISEHIEWISWIEKKEMGKLYESSSLFLFPSHEGAGMVVPESMNYGLPVVCLENCGPGELVGDAGIKVAYGEYNEVVDNLANVIQKIYLDNDLRINLSKKSKLRFEKVFAWPAKGQLINSIYKNLS